MNLKASTLGGFFHVLWDFQVKKGKPPEGSRQPAMVGGISFMGGVLLVFEGRVDLRNRSQTGLEGVVVKL